MMEHAAKMRPPAGIVQWKWWWGWHYEPVEGWLESMAAGGWRLDRVDCGGVRFRFVPAEPAPVRYCIDYRPRPDARWQDLLADDGWRSLPAGAGWVVCWKHYGAGEERPELFTDSDSVIARNRRLMAVLGGIWAAACAPLTVMLAAGAAGQRGDGGSVVLLVEALALNLLYGFFLLRLAAANRTLKRRKALRDV